MKDHACQTEPSSPVAAPIVVESASEVLFPECLFVCRVVVVLIPFALTPLSLSLTSVLTPTADVNRRSKQGSACHEKAGGNE